MKSEFEKVITSEVGVEPIMINSALLSAQNRKRLYWCNWHVEQPEDKGIKLKDIVHEYELPADTMRTFNINPSGRGQSGNVFCVNNDKSPTLTTNKGEGIKISVPQKGLLSPVNPRKHHVYDSDGQDLCSSQKLNVFSLESYIVPFDKTIQILDKEVIKGKIEFFRKDSQSNRIYSIHGKAVTLCSSGGGGSAKMGQYLFGCITPDRENKRQNGQRFSDGQKFYTLTSHDKHGILIDGYIRRLSPIECERLQTLPDGYTESISNCQRYRSLGNGWTVDVIAHIFRALHQS